MREESIPALRERFQRERCLRLEGLLAPPLAHKAGALAATLPFASQSLQIGEREVCEDPGLRGMLLLLLNRPALLDFVERVTGRGPLLSFDGSVYRLSPATDQALSWHDDDPGHRLVGLSLGLSTAGYSGGDFVLRRKGEERPLATHSQLGLGQALLIDVDPSLEHCVTPVTGDSARTAFAGWFVPEPLRAFRSPGGGHHTPAKE